MYHLPTYRFQTNYLPSLNTKAPRDHQTLKHITVVVGRRGFWGFSVMEPVTLCWEAIYAVVINSKSIRNVEPRSPYPTSKVEHRSPCHTRNVELRSPCSTRKVEPRSPCPIRKVELLRPCQTRTVKLLHPCPIRNRETTIWIRDSGIWNRKSETVW